MHRANPYFWKFNEQLPKEIQEFADENYELIKRDPGIHRFTSGRSGECGLPGWVSTIGQPA